MLRELFGKAVEDGRLTLSKSFRISLYLLLSTSPLVNFTWYTCRWVSEATTNTHRHTISSFLKSYYTNHTHPFHLVTKMVTKNILKETCKTVVLIVQPHRIFINIFWPMQKWQEYTSLNSNIPFSRQGLKDEHLAEMNNQGFICVKQHWAVGL